MYHRFGETKYPSTNITVEQLESHLNYLVEQNYRFIQASDLLDPEQQKEKTITVTIDDAYLSFYEVGLPIFEKYQVPVTLFLNTENVGGFNYMSWDQLRDSLRRGVEIQNHSHTHSSFATLDEEAIMSEIETSQNLIFTNLNITPNLFAFPFGESSDLAQKTIERYFDAAFGQHSGAFSMNYQYYIPRFPLNENYGSLDRLRDISKSLPFEAAQLQPSNPTLNPPSTRFVLDVEGGVNGVNCFIADFQGSIEKKMTVLENKLLIELSRMPVSGRLRFNCTKVDNDIFWYGHQYFLN
ncbi:MAG: polysaccharide deacetylase family protein [Proteobacteria bacterium]|jgi:peptidoglycan/xylan/chitin deacetylase (PgdA/CDA1 family)|nr:polysaccharide deacetylase family protein [Pseudomonadota bacterium]